MLTRSTRRGVDQLNTPQILLRVRNWPLCMRFDMPRSCLASHFPNVPWVSLGDPSSMITTCKMYIMSLGGCRRRPPHLQTPGEKFCGLKKKCPSHFFTQPTCSREKFACQDLRAYVPQTLKAAPSRSDTRKAPNGRILRLCFLPPNVNLRRDSVIKTVLR